MSNITVPVPYVPTCAYTSASSWNTKDAQEFDLRKWNPYYKVSVSAKLQHCSQLRGRSKGALVPIRQSRAERARLAEHRAVNPCRHHRRRYFPASIVGFHLLGERRFALKNCSEAAGSAVKLSRWCTRSSALCAVEGTPGKQNAANISGTSCIVQQQACFANWSGSIELHVNQSADAMLCRSAPNKSSWVSTAVTATISVLTVVTVALSIWGLITSLKNTDNVITDFWGVVDTGLYKV